jgi:hypothetical protein
MSHAMVQACLGVVEESLAQQMAELTRLGATGAMSRVAMQNAAAGMVTEGNYQAHQQQGQVLRQALTALREDIAATQNVMVAGEDQAEQMARSAAPGAITNGMLA